MLICLLHARLEVQKNYTALGKAILSVKSDSEIEDYFNRISIVKYQNIQLINLKL